MALHRLTSLTVGVPNVTETAAYYTDFGLTPDGDGWFTTRDAGRQLRIVHAPSRRLVEVRVGVDTPDDLAAAASRLERLGVESALGAGTLTAYDRTTGVRAVLEIGPRVVQHPVAAPVHNGPGRIERAGSRAPGVLRTERVRPRKLGHAVVGTTDFDATTAFFRDGLGFKASDYIKGHGAAAMLEDHPERHVWGLGRHHAGSNFFWYLKDPAGNFSEYYSDMDCIVDDQLWTPEVLEGAKGLFDWGPPPPPSFLAPEDLAALMTGTHSESR